MPAGAGATRPASNAATPTAPAPSTYSFARSISSTIASAIDSSSTVTISSIHRSTSGRVIAPGALTAIPSASVATGPTGAGWPEYGAHTAAWTPTIRTAGRST